MNRLFVRTLKTIVLTILALLPSCNASAEIADWGFNGDVFVDRLRQDWAFQDGIAGLPVFEDANGHAAARALLERVLTSLESDENADSYGEELTYEVSLAHDAHDESSCRIDASVAGVAALRSRVDALVQENLPSVDGRWRDVYYDACRIRRARRLADVAELSPSFVYTKHFVLGASHYAYTEDVSDEWFHDYSVNRQRGGQLCRGTFASDGKIRNEVLVETVNGTLRDPDVSWDGERVLFSMRNSLESDDFHLYEYDVTTGKTRQITNGKGVADIEPIYLPNGDLLFGSTRCTQITDCWWTEVSNFYTCNAQGEYLRRVSFDQVTVNYPKLLDDGRVVYTRWDYNDRGQIFPQALFQMNYDGTAQTEYYGNNSYFPTTVMHARGIPGSDRVIAIASGHHTYQNGKLVVLDRGKGTQENSGCTLIAPIRETPAERIDQYGQRGELFQYPYPLDETTLLCAYLPEGGAWQYHTPFGLYWFDHDGARELLAYDPSISCGQPMPLQEREIPTTRPSQVDLSQQTGKYYVQDVYEGPGLEGVARGTVKKLRVVALEFRCAGVRQNGNGGPAGGALISTPPAVGNGTWDVKHVLGEVPVESDGSAYFEVPAQTPVYFQLLDAKDDVVQTMRSWSTLQPGETFGCVGCHEAKGSVIENAASNAGATTIAIRRAASIPTPVLTPGEGRFQESGMSFVRDIQPILDGNCVRCHDGAAGNPVSLKGDVDSSPRGVEINEKSGRDFSEAYLFLTQYGNHNGFWTRWLGIQEGPEMLPPYLTGAAVSPLIQLFRQDELDALDPIIRDRVASVQASLRERNLYEAHRDVRLDDRSVKLLAMWIDLLVPYCGDYLEANNWTSAERAQYEYYWAKRLMNDSISEFNQTLKHVSETTGDSGAGKDSRYVSFGGLEDREAFLNGYLNRRLPSVARRTGSLNVYRNVALNRRDVQGDRESVGFYPHASSNSEYGYLREFAAKNAIDGVTSNEGHGPDYPSWGPNLRTDLWLNVDFGCEVEIDKCVLYLRADFPHDGVWESATLEFSDGSREPITLKATAEPQTFTFSKRRVTSVKLVDLKPSEWPLKWCGVTEIEYWGTSVE